MVKAWEPTTPKARIEVRPVWINVLEYLFTTDKDVFTTREVSGEIQKNFPGITYRRAMSAFNNVRIYLVRNGIIASRKIGTGKGGGGGLQQSITILNRERIPVVIKRLPLQHAHNGTKPKNEKIDPPAAAPDVPASGVLMTRSERVIAALYKRCLEYKKEVAELIDELAACRASVHDATAKVNQTNKALRRSEEIASEIDLAEVGISLEE